MHPRFELPAPPDQNLKDQKKPPVIICHFCGEHGHKAIHCSKISAEINKEGAHNDDVNKENDGNEGPQPQQSQVFQRSMPKKLEDVTCYKCGTKGHYANRCPKGHLAFLSQAKALQDNQNQNN